MKTPLECLSSSRRVPTGLALAVVLGCGPAVSGASGDLIGFLPFTTVAPQDIAKDRDGSYWVTAFLDNRVYHYDENLAREIESFPYPVPSTYPTGIAYNSRGDTLLVTDALSGKILEVHKETKEVLAELSPDFEQAPQGRGTPYPRGMAFDPLGDEGRGSLYVVEAAGTLIYELRLDGTTLRRFSHPDDPDAFPGRGQTAFASDVDLIYDAAPTRLAGFYVTGGRQRLSSIRRLDVNGEYHGVSISLDDAGGNVSGLLRTPFARPDSGQEADTFLCVVESNARFALLEGGEPEFREIVGFTCTAAGREVSMSWQSFASYDRIEIARGCEVLATLPGTATEWIHAFATDGVHALTLTASQGSRSFSPPVCTVVIGAGEVIGSAPVGGTLPVDLASDGAGGFLVIDPRDRLIRLFHPTLQAAGEIEIRETVGAADDLLTGIAYAGGDPGRIFVFNATAARLAILDDSGVHTATIDVQLPNLEEDPAEEPDRGTVVGMAFDAGGDLGRGSLWLVEVQRDWIYEIDLEGRILGGFRHPYWDVEPPPADTPFGISTGGIALVPGRPGELYLTGGALRDLRQAHILRVRKATGEVIRGSAIPTAGIRRAATDSLLTLEADDHSGAERLVVLALAGDQSKLLDVRLSPPPVAAPTFLTAEQTSLYPDLVRLSFVAGAAYDALEVYRDCQLVATVPGDVTSYPDAGATPGFRDYAVRGVIGGVESDAAFASLQVGPGAIVQRAFLWPARSPQQLAQDPVDGTFAVSVNWPGDERKVYHYDGDLRHVRTRESVVDPEWEIATLAISASPGAERRLHYLTWQLPVPPGEVDQQKFRLVAESIAGEALGEREIAPPRPTNGFITFPTGLSWDPRSDTLYYLERNSKTFVQMSLEGDTLRTFPHPSPPFQNFVFNLGLDVVPWRGAIFITGSDRADQRVTRILEMTPEGRLTGYSIPIGRLPVTVTGIAVEGDTLVAVGTGSFSEIFRLKAFDEPVSAFIRGDADRSGAVDLTDAVVILGHLFRGGTAPPCLDAADADDSGSVNLTDAVAILLRLFQGAAPLPAPYPGQGGDPTPDGLPCS